MITLSLLLLPLSSRAALFAGATQDQPITIRAGFYSVREVAEALAKQGVEAEAGADAAQDVYAIRAEKVPWSALREAMGSDGRLTFEPNGNRWLIRRNLNEKTREKRQWDAYMETFRTRVRAVFGAAATACLELEKLPPDQRTSLAESMLRPDAKPPLPSDVSKLVYLYASAHDIPWSQIAIPWQLSLRTGPVLARPTTTTLLEARGTLFPNGDLRELAIPGLIARDASDADFATFAKAVRVGGSSSSIR